MFLGLFGIKLQSSGKIITNTTMETSTDYFFEAWTSFRDIRPKDRLIFDSAINGLSGVKYSPIKVSTQVTIGTNYRFNCAASLPQSNTIVWQVVIEIFKPLNTGQPYITQIIQI